MGYHSCDQAQVFMTSQFIYPQLGWVLWCTSYKGTQSCNLKYVLWGDPTNQWTANFNLTLWACFLHIWKQLFPNVLGSSVLTSSFLSSHFFGWVGKLSHICTQDFILQSDWYHQILVLEVHILSHKYHWINFFLSFFWGPNLGKRQMNMQSWLWCNLHCRIA